MTTKYKTHQFDCFEMHNHVAYQVSTFHSEFGRIIEVKKNIVLCKWLINIVLCTCIFGISVGKMNKTVLVNRATKTFTDILQQHGTPNVFALKALL